MASVAINNVSKEYSGGVVALRDISLTVEDGEFFVLVGPSGCGKSTLLRMIAGLEEITSGDILIDGVRINDVPPKDRDVAMVFQNYALYPHMTVFQNMSFALKHRKTPKDEIRQRVEAAAEILELGDYLHRKPQALSGGQRQRVAVGRAMVRDPNVFLFDEPLSNLDAKLRLQMRVEISRLHKKLKTTMIYVTHDQIEAMTMGTRIVVLKDGEVQQVDTPHKLYKHPANRFVAGFIGSPAMNFFEGALEDGQKFVSPGLSCDLPDSIVALFADLPGQGGVLGVRPEHLYDAARTGDVEVASNINVTVDVVEPVGADVYVYFYIGDSHCCMRVGANTNYHPGDAISVCFDAQEIKLFHPDSGESVAAP
ncbi:MAG: sn-glycerol-3-phosphate ABC transporter ATP-binding protein UgpC [Candidatus Marinimicrobia bacterium]|nr:sn-glycerol-3-phosphate ABC transporter ATP-binding protein UgpC [Candidatus Neomarinimicrobiota bacterium]